MKEDAEKKRPSRIGFVMASIHTGSANDMWSTLARRAAVSDSSLFVFPVGRLHCPNDAEYLRNDLIPLVNSRNVDALVSWSSSLGGFVSAAEVAACHEKFDVPYVTVGMKMLGHANVEFDAYTGVRSAVLHCIRVHGARKIAFIRGPEVHSSAQDRYRAYLDVLALSGLELSPRLVTPPLSWSRGGDALDILVGERGLVPGRDFDTLVCASDMLMYGAGRRLEAMGIRIPQDVRLIGFNDTRESRLLQTPCTTVRMPIADLGTTAWNLILKHFSVGKGAFQDVMLPAELVIRHSCGCDASDAFGSAGLDGNLRTLASRLAETFHATDKDVRRIEELWKNITSAAVSSDKNRQAEVEREFASFVYDFFSGGGNGDLLFEALQRLRAVHHDGEALQAYLNQRLYPLVSQVQDRVHNHHLFVFGQRTHHLNSLKFDLLSVRSLSVIPELLARHLPGLGMTGAWLVQTAGDGSMSRLLGGYDGKGLINHEQTFSHEDLLPRDIMEKLEQGVYVVEALYMEKQSIGYLVIRTEEWDGSTIEELRASLGSAIKGALLVDEANRAREKAEQAERIRTEFLSSIGEDLKNPLDEIQRLVSRKLQTVLSPDVVSGLKNHVSRAGHLIDLALSRTGTMEMEMRIVSFGGWLRNFCQQHSCEVSLPDHLPSVVVDVKRLEQVCEIMCTDISDDGQVCRIEGHVTAQGLVLSFGAASGRWQARLFENSPGMSLAEKIILMHGGSFLLGDTDVSLTIPWPTLSGEAASSHTGPVVVLANHGEQEESAALYPDAIVVAVEDVASGQEIPQDASLFIWNARHASASAFSVFRMMEQHSRFRSTGCAVYGLEREGASLLEALEALSGDVSVGTVFVYGEVPSSIRRVFGPLEVVVLTTPSDFVSRASVKTPVLLVSDRLAAYDVTTIRRQVISGDVPILLYKNIIDEATINSFGEIPGLILCDDTLAECEAFQARIKAIMGSSASILPAFTGALVKKAIAFLQAHASEQVSRWQVAESVNVSEDYLTRIFRKELGISPWDYLIRYRISLSVRLLRTTGMTISEVASRTGFQDQAYFCRVFKKVMGESPGKMRGH